MEPGTSCTQSGCVTTAPPSQLRISIEVKPFTQTRPNLRARHFQQKHFSVIFLHALATIFDSFSYLREYVSLLKYG